MIVGHKFDIFGFCTIAMPDGAGCPVRQHWLEQQCFENPTTKSGYGYAHTSYLSDPEYQQIQQSVLAKRKRAEAATFAAAGHPIYEEEQIE